MVLQILFEGASMNVSVKRVVATLLVFIVTSFVAYLGCVLYSDLKNSNQREMIFSLSSICCIYIWRLGFG
jgi:hypothetical protein